jgi:hypothetical protein
MHAALRGDFLYRCRSTLARELQLRAETFCLNLIQFAGHCANYVLTCSKEEMMMVYADREQIPWRGKLWCHLVADSLDELHAFAAAIGLKRSWFQDRASYPHYDITMSVRERAIKRGALSVGKREMLQAARKLKAELTAQRASALTVPAPPAREVPQQVSLPLF